MTLSRSAQELWNLRVAGASMYPSIREGQIVKISLFEGGPPRRELIRPGDVLLYLFEGRCLIHRVISAGETELVMAGDWGGDPHGIPVDAVLGRVHAGWWNRGPMGWITHRMVMVLYALSRADARPKGGD